MSSYTKAGNAVTCRIPSHPIDNPVSFYRLAPSTKKQKPTAPPVSSRPPQSEIKTRTRTLIFSHEKRRPFERLLFSDWCGWRDLNSHGYSHYRLKIARLPVPPQPRGREAAGSQISFLRADISSISVDYHHFFVVRLVRLELTRPCDHYPLKVARLPFRHSRIWCLRTESNR